MRLDDKQLSVTSYAVLGLLTFGEMSGYDVMKLAQRSVGHFWSPAKSQVYAELKRLAEYGLATERHVEQDQRPDKRVYSTTPAGEQALRQWLEEAEVVPDQVKSVFTLRVFFGGLIPKESLVAQIKEMRRQTESTLAELRESERRIKNDDSFFYPYLTLRAGLAHARADIRWADDALKLLEQREER